MSAYALDAHSPHRTLAARGRRICTAVCGGTVQNRIPPTRLERHLRALARHEMRRLRPLATPHRARLQPERRGGSIRRSEMLSPRSVRENHHQDSEKIESGATVAAKNLGIYPGSPELGSWSLSAVREAADAAQVPPRDPGLRESRSGSGRLIPRRTAGGPRTRETALGDHPPPEASSSFR